MRILISHGDLDGVMCRVLGQLLKIKGLYDFSRFYHYNYTDEDEMMLTIMNNKEIKEIVFTDFSPTVELYKYCEKNRIRVQIFDHHISAYQNFSDEDGNLLIPNFIFDNTKCGTRIFYENFYIPLAGSGNLFLDYIVSLVDVYDLWKDTSMLWEEASNLQRVFSGMIDYRSDDTYYKFISLQVHKAKNMKDGFEFLPVEKAAIEKVIMKEEEMLEQAKETVEFRVDSQGISYMYVPLRSKISFVASKLLYEFSEYQYIVIRNMYTGGTEHSLRCKDGFDVRKIAEKHAGGGHMLAAGLVLTESMAEDLSDGRIHLN